MRNEKKRDAGPKIIALTFFQKGIVSLYEKLFSINPALFWESRSSRFWLQLSSASTPFGEASRALPEQGVAFFQSKYTFCFQQGKMDEEKFFEPAGDSRYNHPSDKLMAKSNRKGYD